MNKVIVITDSTCDLTPQLIEEKNIVVLPLYVCFGDETYKDGVDITPEKLYELADEKKAIPKTCAGSVYDFIELFKPYVEDGCDVFFTGISSKMSSSMQNAITASKEFDEGRVCISDSLNLSSAIGLLVLKACKLRDEGKSALEIKQAIDEIAPKVKAGFVIKTMDYLYKGGRCGAISMIFGTILKIKPFIRTKDGTMFVYKKPRGKMSSAVDVMIDEAFEDFGKIDEDYIMITYSIGAEEYADYIEEKLNEKGFSNVTRTDAGCVISSHCGKGTIGILYIQK